MVKNEKDNLYKYKSAEVLYSTSPEDAAVNMVLSKLAYTNPLIEAVKKGDIPKVQRLLNEGVNPKLPNHDWFGWTPLHHAAWYGHDKIVKLLLNAGAKKDIESFDGQATPMDFAFEKNHI